MRLLPGCIAACAVVGAFAAFACEPPPSPSGPFATVAAIHRSHCGACHTRVDPGTRTRAQLAAALPHHHNRVHMTDAEWDAMLEYLATPPRSVADASP